MMGKWEKSLLFLDGIKIYMVQECFKSIAPKNDLQSTTTLTRTETRIKVNLSDPRKCTCNKPQVLRCDFRTVTPPVPYKAIVGPWNMLHRMELMQISQERVDFLKSASLSYQKYNTGMIDTHLSTLSLSLGYDCECHLTV